MEIPVYGRKRALAFTARFAPSFATGRRELYLSWVDRQTRRIAVARTADFSEYSEQVTLPISSDSPTALTSGRSGFLLAWAVIAPGRRSRAAALRHLGERAMPIVSGAAGMLVVAALIEAFWSPSPVPGTVKLAVGGVLWLLVIAYFTLAGRGRAP